MALWHYYIKPVNLSTLLLWFLTFKNWTFYYWVSWWVLENSFVDHWYLKPEHARLEKLLILCLISWSLIAISQMWNWRLSKSVIYAQVCYVAKRTMFQGRKPLLSGGTPLTWLCLPGSINEIIEACVPCGCKCGNDEVHMLVKRWGLTFPAFFFSFQVSIQPSKPKFDSLRVRPPVTSFALCRPS